MKFSSLQNVRISVGRCHPEPACLLAQASAGRRFENLIMFRFYMIEEFNDKNDKY